MGGSGDFVVRDDFLLSRNTFFLPGVVQNAVQGVVRVVQGVVQCGIGGIGGIVAESVFFRKNLLMTTVTTVPLVSFVPESARKVFRMISTRTAIRREDIDGRCFATKVGYLSLYIGYELRSSTTSGPTVLYTYDLYYISIPEKIIQEMPYILNTAHTISTLMLVVTTGQSYTAFELDSDTNVSSHDEMLWTMRMLLHNEQVKLADLDNLNQPVPSYVNVTWKSVLDIVAEDADKLLGDLGHLGHAIVD